MLVLALDTAGPLCSVAVAQRDAAGFRVLGSASERLGRGHSERLLPLVEATLQEAGIGYPQLNRIGVTVGPGSFTGVRVGIATARGLSLALNIPAIGVGSLEALANPVLEGPSSGTAVAALDARRQEVYAWAAEIGSGTVRMEAAVGTPEHLARGLAAAGSPIYLSGSGAPALAAALPGRDLIVVGVADAPDIADVAALAATTEFVGWPAPLYLRSADAKPQSGAAVARA